jgi:hypothetical protein
MRLSWLDSSSSRLDEHSAGRKPSRVRRVVKGGLASALAVVGLVAFATPAFAHNDSIGASTSCSSPLGTGFKITWTIENNFDLAETGSVTSITYGLPTLNSTTYSIAKSPGVPYSSTTLTQMLPATATGTITMDISSKWTDGFTTTDTYTYTLSENCAAPTQTIAGHIYLCDDGNPTTTEETGGTVAASGPTSVPATANPLAPTSVSAGSYTMTATNPAGYTLVTCNGSSSPNPSGTSATESVTVPSGGAGVGIFYVMQNTQTIAGHIYLCAAGTQTTTEVSGGTLAASGPTSVPATANPLAPTSVSAGSYTMTATNPAGYTLVTCGGSSSPNPASTSATESVTVPIGGAGVGIFYVALVTTSSATAPTTSAATPTTPAATTPPISSPATTPTIAVTGAPLLGEWLIGAAALLLGSALVVVARRRRSPEDAAK